MIAVVRACSPSGHSFAPGRLGSDDAAESVLLLWQSQERNLRARAIVTIARTRCAAYFPIEIPLRKAGRGVGLHPSECTPTRNPAHARLDQPGTPNRDLRGPLDGGQSFGATVSG